MEIGRRSAESRATLDLKRALERATLCRALSRALALPSRDLAAELVGLAAALGGEEAARLRHLAACASTEPGTPELETVWHRTLGAGGACRAAESDYQPWRTIGGKGAILGDVAAFYSAFAFDPTVELRESPDNVAVQLSFLGWLHLKEAYALEHGLAEEVEICRQAAERFTDDHLAPWLEVFTEKLEEVGGDGFYGEVARVLRASLTFEKKPEPRGPSGAPDDVAFAGVPLDDGAGAPLEPEPVVMEPRSVYERAMGGEMSSLTKEERPITFGLSEEHRLIERELDEAERAAAARDFPRLRETLAFFEHHVTIHRRKEEEVLFPAMAGLLAGGPVRMMQMEHHEERRLLDALAEGLDGADRDEMLASAVQVITNDIVELLRGHILKEDQILFAMAERTLEGDEATEVTASLDRIGYIPR
ncbi:hemerythrin domain-containing protein [Myxococcota bacterium]|nr:hemerythrin domain-containing protein [Myxococcota bacterium]